MTCTRCGAKRRSRLSIWRRNDLDTLFRVLDDRARKKQKRDGISPFEVGEIRKLYKLRDRATVMRRRVEMVIAQPGFSAPLSRSGVAGDEWPRVNEASCVTAMPDGSLFSSASQ